MWAPICGNFEQCFSETYQSRMAPEVRTSESYTTKSDVFSYGIILWEICSGLTPNRNMEEVRDGFRPTFPATWSARLPEIVLLSDQCCDFNPGKRPSFHEIITSLQECRKRVDSVQSLTSPRSASTKRL